jgi:hypothetical protein
MYTCANWLALTGFCIGARMYADEEVLAYCFKACACIWIHAVSNTKVELDLDAYIGYVRELCLRCTSAPEAKIQVESRHK